LYDIFGKDYIGYSQDKFLFNQHALVVKMKIEAGRSAAT
jgi:PmbA protein